MQSLIPQQLSFKHVEILLTEVESYCDFHVWIGEQQLCSYEKSVKNSLGLVIKKQGYNIKQWVTQFSLIANTRATET